MHKNLLKLGTKKWCCTHAPSIRLSSLRRAFSSSASSSNSSTPPSSSSLSASLYLNSADCSLEDLLACVPSDGLNIKDYPHAAAIEQDVVIYDTSYVLNHSDRHSIQHEIKQAFDTGGGIAVFKNAYSHDVVDDASKAYQSIMKTEREHGNSLDHFAEAGANSRVWNSLEKLAVESPSAYVNYFANPLVPLVSEAWVGPGYQVTLKPPNNPNNSNNS